MNFQFVSVKYNKVKHNKMRNAYIDTFTVNINKNLSDLLTVI